MQIPAFEGQDKARQRVVLQIEAGRARATAGNGPHFGAKDALQSFSHVGIDYVVDCRVDVAIQLIKIRRPLKDGVIVVNNGIKMTP